MTMAEKDTSNRGFGSMDEERQREIASKGGHVAHEKGAAHEFTPEEAKEAGRKGGETVSEDREHMSEIGRKGGDMTAKMAVPRTTERKLEVVHRNNMLRQASKAIKTTKLFRA
jgi:general stress protein YciG